ncbi:hypothetical protein, partial [Pseudomonas jilinensis]
CKVLVFQQLPESTPYTEALHSDLCLMGWWCIAGLSMDCFRPSAVRNDGEVDFGHLLYMPGLRIYPGHYERAALECLRITSRSWR